MISTVYSTTMGLYNNQLCLFVKDASWLEFFKQLFSSNNEIIRELCFIMLKFRYSLSCI